MSPGEAENSGKNPKEAMDKSKTEEDNSPADTSEDKSGTDHLEIEKASHLDNGQLKGTPVEGEKPVRKSKHSDLKKHEKPNKGEKSKYSTDTKERGIGEMHLKDSSTKERQSDQKKDHVSETHKKEQKSKQEEASRENSSDAPEGSGVTKKESSKTKETGVHLERKK
ncbi:hypothetical protein EOD39_10201 [Acipenser ruthenus]|uniref:Uncharacterized protein n=1 Tax=Acipenser ruthenus TaxID=7906 RepID=A0A444TYG6_ACIRT|nr:hypothetical protein EOD39_10201 [Acipenser ruthenus]